MPYSLATWAFPLEESQNNNVSTNEGRGLIRGKNTTLKHRTKPERHRELGDRGTHVQELKNSVYGEDGPGPTSDVASGNLGDFDGLLEPPDSVGAERCRAREASPKSDDGPAPICSIERGQDKPCSTEGFDDLTNARINDYYARAVPMYKEGSIQTNEREIMLAKLNHMIHLLEEQRDERTGHVTEEIILYCFLGIFMIFMIDSFARAGKYVR